MIINHNMMAMNANRMANINQSNASKAMAQLSSGLRINGAADDASGLAISEKMKGQINGLNQASSNAQNGISLAQTAEGALNETTSVLQRMRELAVQSANDTNTTADRQAIQTETDQLTAQIDNIGNTTQFNTKNLLNGGAGVTGTSTLAADSVIGGTAATTDGSSVVVSAATLSTNATATRAGIFTGGVSTAAATLNVNGTNFSFAIGTTSAQALQAINNAGLGVTATASATDLTLTSNALGSAATFKSDAVAQGVTVASTGTDATITTVSGNYTAQGNVVTMTSGASQGLQMNIGSIAASTFNVKNNSLSMQIGANSGQTMAISINSMTSTALGVNGLNLTTQAGAQSAMDAIDKATATVSTERAKLGAYQNRLESTINNLGTSSQNLTSAQSQIADVDMAATMAEFSKDNVESQAAQAMLAQANQQPQQVLQLLR
jgi:flagellin